MSISGKAIPPRRYQVSDIRHRLMQPALTSHFHCHFHAPEEVKKQLGFNNLNNDEVFENLRISCSEASLPGSTIATTELNNDFTGVTQRHAYRRLYDDRADFTFYVNQNYEQIRVFEVWLRYISGEQLSFDSNGTNKSISYRVQYPVNYKTDIYITKFERDYGIKRSRNTNLTYTFVNAFPLSINSMPVSYDSSQLLKCTVSFTYDRYFMDGLKTTQPQGEPSQSTATGVPNPSEVSYAGGQVATDAFTGNASLNESSLFNNIAPSQYNISPGTLSNSVGEGEELANAVTRRVEEGLPYVGRNVGPLAP